MTNDDEKPHEHANYIHVSTGSARSTALAAALAHLAKRERPEILIVDDRYDDPPPVPKPCCDGHALCEQHQNLKDLTDQLPRTRVAHHRGKSLLELMVGLGATPPPAPAPAPDYPDRPDLCIRCRLRLFGGARGQMTAERCAGCRAFLCGNCDAEHDGVDWHPNHTADILCVYYEG